MEGLVLVVYPPAIASFFIAFVKYSSQLRILPIENNAARDGKAVNVSFHGVQSRWLLRVLFSMYCTYMAPEVIEIGEDMVPVILVWFEHVLLASLVSVKPKSAILTERILDDITFS